jgi:hypothetical protein
MQDKNEKMENITVKLAHILTVIVDAINSKNDTDLFLVEWESTASGFNLLCHSKENKKYSNRKLSNFSVSSYTTSNGRHVYKLFPEKHHHLE